MRRANSFFPSSRMDRSEFNRIDVRPCGPGHAARIRGDDRDLMIVVQNIQCRSTVPPLIGFQIRSAQAIQCQHGIGEDDSYCRSLPQRQSHEFAGPAWGDNGWHLRRTRHVSDLRDRPPFLPQYTGRRRQPPFGSLCMYIKARSRRIRRRHSSRGTWRSHPHSDPAPLGRPR